MKDTHYEVNIRFMVSPEQVIEGAVLPQRAFYRAHMVRGPFLESKEAGAFEQKAWHSANVLEWPTPASEPLELMPSKDALLELLSMVRDSIERES